MKLTIDDINRRVSETDGERTSYRLEAAQWERMWRLERETETRPRNTRNADVESVDITANEAEQVTMPTPYNIVALATRLIATMPRVEVPSTSGEQEVDDDAARRESWLTAYWQRLNKQARRNLIEDLAWFMLVRGRAAVEVLWVEDELPSRLKGRRLPVIVRAIDPLCVGVRQGPLYTEYAYHKTMMRRGSIRQFFPDFDWQDSERPNQSWSRADDEEYEIVSFYYTNPADGVVWYAVTVDGRFAQEPQPTEWIDIPLVEVSGDSAPLGDELYRGMSILHPLKEMWPLQNRIMSWISTGLMYYFLPIITISNPNNILLPDIEVGPNRTYQLPAGVAMDMIRPDVNVPLASTMLQAVDASIQQSTFPGVMYGKEPGQVQAGYGVNILANQAKGRINVLRENLESLIEHVNELLLFCVDVLAGNDGVAVWGFDDRVSRPYQVTLKPDDINGNYENMVHLLPENPMDDMAKILQAKQLVEAGLMSRMTFWNRVINYPMPNDEYVRIAVEKTMEDDTMRPKWLLRALQERFPKSWEEFVFGTPLQQVAEADAQYQQQQKAEKQAKRAANAARRYAETGIVPNGFMLMPDGTLAPANAAPPPGMMPPGMMPPGMMPPGMMPPGGMPMDGGAMPPGAMPPGMQPPGMMGVPPEMAGQMTPEMLGLPPGAPPGMFQEMTGQGPLPDEEMLRRLSGGQMPPA
jgi:hypothetical protein